MGNKPKGSQNEHDKVVRREAKNLVRNGWTVRADLPGYEPPKPIGKKGVVPDIVASKRGHTRIVEVETPDSLDSDREQRATIARSAGQKSQTTFETIVTEK